MACSNIFFIQSTLFFLDSDVLPSPEPIKVWILPIITQQVVEVLIG